MTVRGSEVWSPGTVVEGAAGVASDARVSGAGVVRVAHPHIQVHHLLLPRQQLQGGHPVLPAQVNLHSNNNQMAKTEPTDTKR